MTVLGIDTSAVSASAAVIEDGRLIAETYTNVGLQHSRTLMPMVENMLACCEMPLSHIDRFAVTVGPGSFTGVRIGVAAVKGLALAADTPCVGVSTLHAIAMNLPPADGIVCPVMDARCDQVYNALFAWRDGALTRLCEDRALSMEELFHELSSLNQPVTWLGDGAALCYDRLPDRTGHVLPPEAMRLQRASRVALLAESANETVDAAHLTVSYLRPPQAVRNQANR